MDTSPSHVWNPYWHSYPRLSEYYGNISDTHGNASDYHGSTQNYPSNPSSYHGIIRDHDNVNVHHDCENYQGIHNNQNRNRSWERYNHAQSQSYIGNQSYTEQFNRSFEKENENVANISLPHNFKMFTELKPPPASPIYQTNTRITVPTVQPAPTKPTRSNLPVPVEDTTDQNIHNEKQTHSGLSSPSRLSVDKELSEYNYKREWKPKSKKKLNLSLEVKKSEPRSITVSVSSPKKLIKSKSSGSLLDCSKRRDAMKPSRKTKSSAVQQDCCVQGVCEKGTHRKQATKLKRSKSYAGRTFNSYMAPTQSSKAKENSITKLPDKPKIRPKLARRRPANRPGSTDSTTLCSFSSYSGSDPRDQKQGSDLSITDILPEHLVVIRTPGNRANGDQEDYQLLSDVKEEQFQTASEHSNESQEKNKTKHRKDNKEIKDSKAVKEERKDASTKKKSKTNKNTNDPNDNTRKQKDLEIHSSDPLINRLQTCGSDTIVDAQELSSINPSSHYPTHHHYNNQLAYQHHVTVATVSQNYNYNNAHSTYHPQQSHKTFAKHQKLTATNVQYPPTPPSKQPSNANYYHSNPTSNKVKLHEEYSSVTDSTRHSQHVETTSPNAASSRLHSGHNLQHPQPEHQNTGEVSGYTLQHQDDKPAVLTEQYQVHKSSHSDNRSHHSQRIFSNSEKKSKSSDRSLQHSEHVSQSSAPKSQLPYVTQHSVEILQHIQKTKNEEEQRHSKQTLPKPEPNTRNSDLKALPSNTDEQLINTSINSEEQGNQLGSEYSYHEYSCGQPPAHLHASDIRPTSKSNKTSTGQAPSITDKEQSSTTILHNSKRERKTEAMASDQQQQRSETSKHHTVSQESEHHTQDSKHRENSRQETYKTQNPAYNAQDDAEHKVYVTRHHSYDAYHQTQRNANNTQHETYDAYHPTHDVHVTQNQTHNTQYQTYDAQQEPYISQQGPYNQTQFKNHDAQYQANDSYHQANDSYHQANDSHHQANDSRHQTNDSHHHSQDMKLHEQTPDLRHPQAASRSNKRSKQETRSTSDHSRGSLQQQSLSAALYKDQQYKQHNTDSYQHHKYEHQAQHEVNSDQHSQKYEQQSASYQNQQTAGDIQPDDKQSSQQHFTSATKPSDIHTLRDLQQRQYSEVIQQEYDQHHQSSIQQLENRTDRRERYEQQSDVHLLQKSDHQTAFKQLSGEHIISKPSAEKQELLSTLQLSHSQQINLQPFAAIYKQQPETIDSSQLEQQHSDLQDLYQATNVHYPDPYRVMVSEQMIQNLSESLMKTLGTTTYDNGKDVLSTKQTLGEKAANHQQSAETSHKKASEHKLEATKRQTPELKSQHSANTPLKHWETKFTNETGNAMHTSKSRFKTPRRRQQTASDTSYTSSSSSSGVFLPERRLSVPQLVDEYENLSERSRSSFGSERHVSSLHRSQDDILSSINNLREAIENSSIAEEDPFIEDNYIENEKSYQHKQSHSTSESSRKSSSKRIRSSKSNHLVNGIKHRDQNRKDSYPEDIEKDERYSTPLLNEVEVTLPASDPAHRAPSAASSCRRHSAKHGHNTPPPSINLYFQSTPKTADKHPMSPAASPISTHPSHRRSVLRSYDRTDSQLAAGRSRAVSSNSLYPEKGNIIVNDRSSVLCSEDEARADVVPIYGKEESRAQCQTRAHYQAHDCNCSNYRDSASRDNHSVYQTSRGSKHASVLTSPSRAEHTQTTYLNQSRDQSPPDCGTLVEDVAPPARADYVAPPARADYVAPPARAAESFTGHMRDMKRTLFNTWVSTSLQDLRTPTPTRQHDPPDIPQYHHLPDILHHQLPDIPHNFENRETSAENRRPVVSGQIDCSAAKRDVNQFSSRSLQHAHSQEHGTHNVEDVAPPARADSFTGHMSRDMSHSQEQGTHNVCKICNRVDQACPSRDSRNKFFSKIKERSIEESSIAEENPWYGILSQLDCKNRLQVYESILHLVHFR